jgi:hypothetical protein
MLTISHFMVNYTCINEVRETTFNIAKTIVNCCASVSPLFVFVIIMTNGKNGKLAFVKAYKCLQSTLNKLKFEGKDKNRMIGNERFSFY